MGPHHGLTHQLKGYDCLLNSGNERTPSWFTRQTGLRSSNRHLQKPLSLVQVSAKRRKQEEPEYARLDDDYSEPAFSLDNLPKTSGFVLRTLQHFVDRFVDLAFDLAPHGTSRSVVDTTTKGALVLVTLAFASSILSFLLNAGFIALGLYVASKVFNIDIGSKFIGSSESIDSTAAQGPSQRSPQQTSRTRRQKAPAQEDSDVTDVWFERPARRQKS